MTTQKKRQESEALRKRAEEKLQQSHEKTGQELSLEPAQKLLHELQVHQIELEMQNEELRRTQIELEASRSRYFDLYDLAPVGYCTLSEKGLVLESNLKLATLLGMERGLILQQPFSRFIHPEDQDTWYLQFNHFQKTQDAHMYELRMLRAGESSFWVRLDLDAVRKDQGIARECRVTVIDITEQKLIHQRLQSTLEAIPDIMFMVNAEGRIFEYHAPSTSDLYAPPKVFLGKTIREVMPPDVSAIIMKALTRAVMEGVHRGVQYKLDMPQGPRWYELSLSAKKDMLSGEMRFLALIRDITALKKADEVKALIQAQLIHSSRLISLGNLAAGVAHEINNPLMIMKGNISILRDQIKHAGPNEDFLKILHKHDIALERIAEIVKKLGIFARTDAEIVESVDLHKIILETVDFCRTIYMLDKIRIETHLKSVHPQVNGNAGEFRQVLLNLLLNAKDAYTGRTDGGSITIETFDVKVFEKAVEKKSVVLQVSDQGLGIKKEHLPHIFDPFFTTKDPGRGTGLGLSISHSIVGSFGGTITVESTEGKGSSFVIRLPRQ